MNKLVLDVDTGEDDALAILLALAGGLPLDMVVTSFGNTTVENVTANTAAVLELAKATGVRVLQGSSRSLRPHLHHRDGVNAGRFVGEDGLCDMALPRSTRIDVKAPSEEEFAGKLADRLREYGKCVYIVTGPCTNLARVCRLLGAEVHKLIEMVYVMGGALQRAGNTGPKSTEIGKPYAEFNFYCDPWAISEVLQSGLPIRLVTLDTTSRAQIPVSALPALKAGDAVGKFTIDLIEHFFDCYGRAHGRNFELNDPLTIYAAMGYGAFSRERVSVVVEGEQFGRSIVEPGGSEVEVLTMDSAACAESTVHILEKLGVSLSDANFGASILR